ncbi:MAG: tRNA-(ms[2]io[6]A)-hydroxylase [Cytophagaceae bacterium]|jgi:tRNA-(ms[2]io[6]A)-hydroxylase|nr:tRNA-(ms[2]io[6]A)-hydroxylase [Cytophagaceae bacterium]
MLGLKLPSDPRWADVASKRMEDILTDHAYCEQKAASTCISLIVLFPELEELVATLSPIVTEEWGHFRMVLNEMKKRNIALGRARSDAYVSQLAQLERKDKKVRLLDKLLLCALIEARSCERFKLLHEKLEDPELKKFYYDLMISEAGHYRTFLDLAAVYFPAEEVKLRFQELLSQEATIIATLDIRGDRVH